MRLPFLLASASTLLLAAGPPEAIGLRTTLRGETLRLPQQESLGLLGLATTADFGPWYLGPGLYGAARGQRGGFFTFGLEGGLRGRPLSGLPLEAEVGYFLGGGGGAAAPQGSGLMLRPHLGLAWALGHTRLGAELSQVRFPDGAIHSTQGALTLAFTMERLWTPEGSAGPAYDGPVLWEGRDMTFGGERVEPRGSLRARGQLTQQSFDLVGVSFSRELGETWYRYLALEAAARGESSGYSQVLAGLGLHSSSARPVGLEARLGVGLGGGGNVDTGGGLLLSGEAGITAGGPRWKGALGLGFLRAPGGQFDSRTLYVRVAHRSLAPLPASGGEALQGFDLADWRVGTGFIVYQHARRQDGSDGGIQNLTLRADRPLGRGFYFSGEAGSATGGSAGGYSTGLAGLGWETPRWARQRLFAEGALGAGGGGGLVSGGGLIHSYRAGWRLELPRGLGFEAVAGKVKSSKGALDTATLGLGLHLRFSAPER